MKLEARVLWLLPVNTLMGVLTGCATPVPVAKAPEPTAVETLISDHGRRVADATERMVRGLPKVEPAPSIPVMPSDSKVSLKWFGPVESALTGLAKANGFEFLVIGKSPASPIIVSASADASLWSDTVRGIGMQLGRRAELVLDLSRKRLELHYAE